MEDPVNIKTTVNRDSLHPWRRFWAKQIDLLFVIPFFLMLLAISGRFSEFKIESNLDSIVIYLLFILFFLFYETICVHLKGKTFGKYLLRVTIQGSGESKIPFAKAFVRSFRAMAFGNAFCIPSLLLIANWLSYNRLVTTGTTSWDFEARAIVKFENLSKARKVFLTISTMIVIGLYAYMNIKSDQNMKDCTLQCEVMMKNGELKEGLTKQRCLEQLCK